MSLRSKIFLNHLLIGMVGALFSFIFMVTYNDIKIQARIIGSHYAIGGGLVMVIVLGVSWILSGTISSTHLTHDLVDEEDLENQENDQDKGVRLGTDRTKEIELTQQVKILSTKAQHLEQQFQEQESLKSKLENQTVELGNLLTDKEKQFLEAREALSSEVAKNALREAKFAHEEAHRRQIQTVLEANELRYRGIIEGASDALFLTSSAGIIEYASPATKELFETESEQFLGSDINFAFSEDVPILKEFLQKNDPKSSVIYRIQHGNSNLENHRYVLHRLSFLDIPGKRRLVIHSLRDVSQMKQAQSNQAETERQLFHASKLASLGTMAAGVAHELNNPLTAIKGFGEKLRKDLQGTLGESHTFVSMVDKILKQSTRMQTITKKLLVFSRQEPETQMQLIEMEKLIHDALVLHRHQLTGSRMSLEVAVEANMPKVKVHLTNFESVIQNLVGNAFDAHKSHVSGAAGPSSVEPLFIRVRAFEQNNQVILEVSDNAGGISKESLAKIFDPFFTTKGPGKGTGLGLALVQTIVADHQGTIKVESEEGKGTCFRVAIPKPAEETLGIAA